MTTYPDRLYHMGGMPVAGGTELMNRSDSKTYFVDTTNGSDGNAGESHDTAFATIAAAITAANARIDWSTSPWAKNDIIIIMPGTYAENLTSLPYGCTMIGLGHDTRDAQFGVKIKPASGDPVDVGAMINTAIYNIGFDAPGTTPAFDADVCNNNYFENCFFSGPPETTTCTEAFITTDATKTTFNHCWFANAGVGMKFNYTDANDKACYILIENCVITGCSTDGIFTHANLVGPHFVARHNTIVGGGQTLAEGIDDNAGIIDESFNAIEATTAVAGVRSSNGSYGNGALLT